MLVDYLLQLLTREAFDTGALLKLAIRPPNRDYRREWKEQPRWNSLAVERGWSNILATSSNAFALFDPVTFTIDLLT